MTKELSDLAWSVLPKEFKEEVKYYYQHTDSGSYAEDLLENLFGLHNLTSDAEGEDDETLYVSRKKLQYFYENLRRVGENHAAFALQSLFGSKCLPDDVDTVEHLDPKANSDYTPIPEKTFVSEWDKTEPKPAESKYQVNDKVKVKGTNRIGTIIEPYSNDVGYRVYFNDGDGGEDAEYSVDELIPYEEPKPAEPKYHIGQYVRHKPTRLVDVIEGISQSAPYIYRFKHMVNPINGQGIGESDLEPYTESDKQSRNLSQNIANCDKCPKSVQKTHPDFGHSRLNIAAMAMQGILSNIDLFKNVLETGMEILDGDGISYRAVAKASFLFADALINEAEKGERDGED